MTGIALDTNVVVQMFRAAGGEIPPTLIGRTTVLLLPVVGELFAGAYASSSRDQNLAVTESLWRSIRF